MREAARKVPRVVKMCSSMKLSNQIVGPCSMEAVSSIVTRLDDLVVNVQ